MRSIVQLIIAVTYFSLLIDSFKIHSFKTVLNQKYELILPSVTKEIFWEINFVPKTAEKEGFVVTITKNDYVLYYDSENVGKYEFGGERNDDLYFFKILNLQGKEIMIDGAIKVGFSGEREGNFQILDETEGFGQIEIFTIDEDSKEDENVPVDEVHWNIDENLDDGRIDISIGRGFSSNNIKAPSQRSYAIEEEKYFLKIEAIFLSHMWVNIGMIIIDFSLLLCMFSVIFVINRILRCCRYRTMEKETKISSCDVDVNTEGVSVTCKESQTIGSMTNEEYMKKLEEKDDEIMDVFNDGLIQVNKKTEQIEELTRQLRTAGEKLKLQEIRMNLVSKKHVLQEKVSNYGEKSNKLLQEMVSEKSNEISKLEKTCKRYEKQVSLFQERILEKDNLIDDLQVKETDTQNDLKEKIKAINFYEVKFKLLEENNEENEKRVSAIEAITNENFSLKENVRKLEQKIREIRKMKNIEQKNLEEKYRKSVGTVIKSYDVKIKENEGIVFEIKREKGKLLSELEGEKEKILQLEKKGKVESAHLITKLTKLNGEIEMKDKRIAELENDNKKNLNLFKTILKQLCDRYCKKMMIFKKKVSPKLDYQGRKLDELRKIVVRKVLEPNVIDFLKILEPEKRFSVIKKKLKKITATEIKEISDYRVPPKEIYPVVKSVLLLLEKKNLDSWDSCRSRFRYSLLKEILSYNPKEHYVNYNTTFVEKEIKLLKKMGKNMSSISECANLFYEFVKASLEIIYLYKEKTNNSQTFLAKKKKKRKK